jgi:ubiquinone/menaquinone biosynthesis C-methylase UbiE
MVREGVPIFIDTSDINWSKLEEEVSRSIKIVESNWKSTIKLSNKKSDWAAMCKEISEIGGLILEIAIGLGGGFTPCILRFNPEAKLLAGDMDPVSIYAWRKLYKSKGISKYLSFAVFDATRMPLKSDSFDLVISSGGIGNISFNYLALAETYRVLKSGGKLIFADGVIAEEDFNKLPRDLRVKWLNAYPHLTKGYRGILTDLGYDIVLYKISGIRELDPNEGDLPREAYKSKIRLRYRGVFVKAIKP